MIGVIPCEVVCAKAHRIFLHFGKKSSAEYAFGMQQDKLRFDHIEVDHISIDYIGSMSQMALGVFVFGISCDDPLKFFIGSSGILFAIQRMTRLEIKRLRVIDQYIVLDEDSFN